MIRIIGFFVLNIIIFIIGYYKGSRFAAATTAVLTRDAVNKLPKEMQDAFDKALIEAAKENSTND
jgi:uncharacterized membrane protein